MAKKRKKLHQYFRDKSKKATEARKKASSMRPKLSASVAKKHKPQSYRKAYKS